jgi:hypothetical protein
MGSDLSAAMTGLAPSLATRESEVIYGRITVR